MIIFVFDFNKFFYFNKLFEFNKLFYLRHSSSIIVLYSRHSSSLISNKDKKVLV